MRITYLAATFVAIFGWSCSCLAVEVDFSGTWSIDIRSPSERKKNVECGRAYFELSQVGTKIIGNHEFATPGCGRLNEGGEGTVKGVVVGSVAVLVVTSGRNGAIVMGEATRKGESLRWVTLEEIKPGETQGDSPLILHKGILSRVK